MKSELFSKTVKTQLTVLFVLINLISFGQVNDTVTTIGNNCAVNALSSKSYFQQDLSYSFSNDTLKLYGLFEANCCGTHFIIRKMSEDTIYLNTYDTGMLCTCNCLYDFNTTFTNCTRDTYVLNMHGDYIQKLTRKDAIVSINKRWNILSGGYGSEMVECCLSTYFLKIVDDPTLSNLSEKTLMASYDSLATWEKAGYVSENNGKVYFRKYNQQGLIYDFGAAEGDTIEINYYSLEGYDNIKNVIVKDIDTIEYLGVDRRGFTIEDLYGNQLDYWIEGIGSTQGLLNSCIELTGGFRELLCAYDSDTKIYQNEERGFCFMDEDCFGPVADFEFDILESNPIQIDLNSTTNDVDSIIWKGVSAHNGKDTIIGTSNSMRIKDIYKLEILMLDCLGTGCEDQIEIKQIVLNECGKDSMTIQIPLVYQSSIQNESSVNINYYPNPSNGVLNFIGINKYNLNYIIYNTTGKAIKKGIVEQSIQLNVPDGMYFIIIQNNKEIVKREKLIISNN